MKTFSAITLSVALLCACAGPGVARQRRARHAPLTRKDNRAALTGAARRGDVRALRSTLRKGVSAEAKSAALTIAAGAGHLEPVKILLAAGANPNAIFGTQHWLSTPLGGAIQARDLEVVDVLIGAGAELNPKQNISPLYFAVGQNDVGMVRALIERGADVNLKNVRGMTALMMASGVSSPEVVKALIDAGADVNLTDDKGDTALAIAEKFYEGNGSKEEIVRLLRQAGAKE